MYAESKKSIYDTLEASLIFCPKLSKSLEKWDTTKTIIISVQ